MYHLRLVIWFIAIVNLRHRQSPIFRSICRRKMVLVMYIMIGMAIYSILGAVAVLNEIAYSTRT